MRRAVPVALPLSPAPFVLLDDARRVPGTCARLYRDPVEIVTAWRLQDVAPALEHLRKALGSGLHVAGYLTYEAAPAFEPALTAPGAGDGDQLLLWFGLFCCCTMLQAEDIPDLLPPAAEASTARPLETMERHASTIDRVLDYIRAGDIYQANGSLRATVPIGDDQLVAY